MDKVKVQQHQEHFHTHIYGQQGFHQSPLPHDAADPGNGKRHQSESGKLHDICSNVKAKPEGTGGREGVVIDQADDNECHKAYISEQPQLEASLQPKWPFPFHNVCPPAVLFLQTAPHRSCTVLLSV